MTWEADIKKRLEAADTRNNRFWIDLDEESDRGMVLSIGAHFEELLRQCLLSYFRECDESSQLLSINGPLGGFAARNKMCFAVRIYSFKEYETLKAIAKIRNVFAHELLTSFSDQSMKDQIGQATERFFKGRKAEEIGTSIREKSPREQLSFVAFALSDFLHLVPLDTQLHVSNYPDEIPGHIARAMKDL
ncbi:hypothetical protein [Ruegeria arenilitoris]|uniref:hypothetical protein n=1 Tax=Ruegeria arenilitoris TaxID=1173585 RepID=UPI00147A042F|nr:hypothetical protein [Ruegeria arenilitoris]